MNDQGPIQMTPQQRQAIAKAKARLRLRQQGQPAPVQTAKPPASASRVSIPKPAPMSQPDATPWGDGQAFDDMYARKPQTDPMLSPLRPDARTLTSGQPTRLKPPPVLRGPVMSPAQIKATQPARDEAQRARIARDERTVFNAASPGLAFRDTGAKGTVELNTDGGDFGKGVMASPIHAQRAVVSAAEATLNTPSDFASTAVVPFAMGFDPESQGIVANLEYARDEASVANAMDRFASRYDKGGFRKLQEKIEAGPRFDFSAAKIPVPKELESVTGSLAEGFMQYLAARGALGKFMPGGKAMSQLAKDVGATGIGYSGDSPRVADMLDPESMGLMSDYVRWLKTQPGDSPGMGRVKNMAEDATINLLAMGIFRGGQAISTPQALTPTNAGGVAARAGLTRPQITPVAPAAATQPQQPVAPTATQAPQQAPTQPQTATAPPVPPVPPNAPAVTAGAPMPGPAGQVPPAGQLNTVPNLGPAEQAFNNLPMKTRESMLNAFKSAGVEPNRAKAMIGELNNLPDGQNTMYALEIMRRNGLSDPDIDGVLVAMGREFATESPRPSGRVFNREQDSARQIMNDQVRTQINSEGRSITDVAESRFGPGVVPAGEALDLELDQLSNAYETILSTKRSPTGNLRSAAKKDAVYKAREDLTNALVSPSVMQTIPDDVKLQIMMQASDDMRRLKFKPEELDVVLQGDGAVLAPLFEGYGALSWSPELWSHLARQYPTQAAHSLQSALRKAADEAFRRGDATAGRYYKRLRGESGKGGLLDTLERAVPKYKETRVQFGDASSAKEALDILERFKAAAANEGDVAKIIKDLDGLPQRHREMAEQQITSIIRQELARKVESPRLAELGQTVAQTPNLTALSRQDFLKALEDVFGPRGKELADSIRSSRARTDTLTGISPKYNSRTELNRQDVQNAPALYEAPGSLEGGIIDQGVKRLGTVAGGASLIPGGQGAAIALGAATAVQAAMNAARRGQRLSNAERNALVDYLFKSRTAGDAAPAAATRGPSMGDYAQAIGRDAVIGAGIGAVADGDPLNNDPMAVIGGALGGAAGYGRARFRNARSLIKPPPAPRGAGRPNPPPAGPGVGGPNAPRPLPGQTSSASPAVTGAVVGGIGGAMADREDPARGALLGGLGGGVLGAGAGRLARGVQPPKPRVSPPPVGGRAPPEQMGFGGSGQPSGTRSLLQTLARPNEPQRVADLLAGTPVSVTREEAKEMLDLIRMQLRPKANYGDGGYGFTLDELKADPSIAEHYLDYDPQKLAKFQAVLGTVSPPARNGMPGGSRDLPMDEASRMGRAREQGFDVDTPLYHGTPFKDLEQLNRLHGIRAAKSEYFGEDRGMNSLGIWLSNRADKEGARMYAGKKGDVIPVYARAKKPLVIEGEARPQVGQDKAFQQFYDFIRQHTPESTSHPAMRDMRPVRKWLTDNGYDSVILRNTYGDSKTAPQDMVIILDDGNIRRTDAAFDPSQSQSSKLLAGMGGNSRGIADNLKQDAALAGFGSVGGSFANQDDPQAGALAGMGLALGGKYGPRLANAMRGAGRVKPPPVRGADQAGFGSGKAESRPKGPPLPKDYKKSLAVVHNLSEANLLHADEIGGLAAPSLAVIDSDKGAMTGFGEVSLLADPNILKSGGIRTFDSDVYSPRHPRPEYKITDKKMLDFRDFINKETEGLGDLRGVDWDSVSREGPSALSRNDQVRAAFLKSRGELPARLPRKKMPEDLGAEHVEAAKLPGAAGDRWEFRKNPDLVRIANRHYENEMAKLREIDPSMAKTVEDRIFDVAEDGTKSVSFTYIDRFAQDARRAKEALDGGVDATALSSIISRKLQNKKTADALDEYVSQISSNLFGERRLYKGMTYSGNRRYSPYTMENILREMTKTIRGGENWHYGAGSIRAKYARELKSIDEIRRNKDKLVASGGMEDAKKAIQDKLSDLIFTHLEKYYRFGGGNRFSAMDEMSKAIADGPRALREVFDFKGNPEPMQRIQEFIDELKSMPTEYFEAKANRAVGLNEFAVAIVPKGASPKTIDALKRAGLKIKYYSKGDEASRAKAIQSEKQYLAGLSGSPEAIGAAGGTGLGMALAQDQNGDGVVDAQERMLGGAGGAISGGIAGRLLRGGGGSAPRANPPVAQGFGGRPKPPPAKGPPKPRKGPLMAPSVIRELEAAKKALPPEVRARLAENAARPPALRVSAAEAAGDDPSIYTMAAPFQRTRKPFVADYAGASSVERGVNEGMARIDRQVGAPPPLDAAGEAVRLSERQRRSAAADATRKANALNPYVNEAAGIADKPLPKAFANREEETTNLAITAREILAKNRLTAEEYDQALAAANQRKAAIANALATGRMPPPPLPGATATGVRPGVIGQPLPPRKMPPVSRREADDMAELMFNKENAEMLNSILSGAVTPRNRSQYHAMLLSTAGVATAAAGGIAFGALVDDYNRRNKKPPPAEKPTYTDPGDPRFVWDWEKIKSTQNKQMENIQIQLNALPPNADGIRNNLKPDGKWSKNGPTDRTIKKWLYDNGFDPNGPLTMEHADLLEQQVQEARRATRTDLDRVR